MHARGSMVANTVFKRPFPVAHGPVGLKYSRWGSISLNTAPLF
jgi:hypothetical protein